jgi:hypothetical protein
MRELKRGESPGDFYQLPPVPDINYGDNGQMCYNSLYVKKFFHHVQLDMIHRQEEPGSTAHVK